MRRPCVLVASGVAVAAAALAAPALAAAPREVTLSSGWERRVAPAAPAEPQPAPPEETAPEGAGPAIPATAAGVAAQAPGDWQPARVPSVFDTRALPALYPGQVRRYRVSFRGPATPRGFSWLLRFESVRRNAGVFLNGRRIGRNVDPYTPFTVEARGLRPGRRNELVVIVDGRKDPDLPEAWWNWNGIVRPVKLVPAGTAHIEDLGDDVARELPRAGARLPGRARPRRAAPAPWRPRHRAIARREAARTGRPGDLAAFPPPAPALETASPPALDAGACAGAVVARCASSVRR